ncbi:uncharacterized protein LOC132726955 [Ruditapes philippinarum]|uniref:uncharacterized protein LOC132726955 n=1 Tax=Ruditapes philippinarum TaxID=129788 RepID=UPI00295A85C1|nr:uncharacterized protein LOC132726955 [Ruditapes philippinarum]
MSRQNTKCPTVDRKETDTNTNRNSTGKGKGDTNVRKGKRSTETGRSISFADREISHKSNKRNRNEDKDNVSESQPLKKKKSPDVNETFPDVANIDRQKCNEDLPTSNTIIPLKTKTYSEVVRVKETDVTDTETRGAVKRNLNENDSEHTDIWKVVTKRSKRAAPDDKTHIQQTCKQTYKERPVSTEHVADLVTTYTVKYRKWSIPCLKCRADISQSEETPDIFFRDSELTVTKLTGKDNFEALKLCTIFDDRFVQENKNSFEMFWNQVLNYVKDEKHMIDLHGMSELIENNMLLSFDINFIRQG